MAGHGWRRFLEPLLSIGSLPGESVSRRSGRRVVIVAMVVAVVLSIPTAFYVLDQGYTWDAVMTFLVIVALPVLLLAIKRWPHRFVALVNVGFALAIGLGVAEAAMFGGLWPSGLSPIFGIIVVLGAMVAMSLRAALWWFLAFAGSVAFAVAAPHWIDPIYTRADPTPLAAFGIVSTGVACLAVVAYFVRQRDRFQQQSDDLLRNTLPDEIAERLKASTGTIADDFPEASVLFADLAGFTPMSAAMTPAEVVGLLDEVFRVIDGFVSNLGLEKIKTVGDEYMVAAGVPRPRADHAVAIAELALRIRDHFAATEVNGRRLSFRIGINSGPVTAGVIGTDKFAYDLWGETVNAASRMESSGVPGSIQISAATHALIADAFVCESRGMTSIKGKEPMETFLLVSRRSSVPAGVG